MVRKMTIIIDNKIVKSFEGTLKQRMQIIEYFKRKGYKKVYK
jgi:hypothetical protein